MSAKFEIRNSMAEFLVFQIEGKVYNLDVIISVGYLNYN